MAELVDALDLGSSAVRRAGSIPVFRTKHNQCNHPGTKVKEFPAIHTQRSQAGSGGFIDAAARQGCQVKIREQGLLNLISWREYQIIQ